MEILIKTNLNSYFLDFIENLIKEITNPTHKVMVIYTIPYQQSVMEYYSNDETISISFNPTPRGGFEPITDQERKKLIEHI